MTVMDVIRGFISNGTLVMLGFIPGLAIGAYYHEKFLEKSDD